MSLSVNYFVANVPICPIEMYAELTYSGGRPAKGIDLSRMAVLTNVGGRPKRQTGMGVPLSRNLTDS